MSRDLHYDSLNISKEWFRIGLSKRGGDEPSEIAFRFIAYWIAFNGFYARSNVGGMREYEQIEEYIKTSMPLLTGLFDFDEQPELAIFREYPVFDRDETPQAYRNYKNYSGHNHNILYYQILTDRQQSECERMNALVQTIYQIRCNMFHGSKTPYPDRNYQLVYASQWVMERILKRLIVR